MTRFRIGSLYEVLTQLETDFGSECKVVIANNDKSFACSIANLHDPSTFQSSMRLYNLFDLYGFLSSDVIGLILDEAQNLFYITVKTHQSYMARH